jgi:magnesium transporter
LLPGEGAQSWVRRCPAPGHDGPVIGEHAPTTQESDDILRGRLDHYLVTDVPVCLPGDDVVTIWASLRGHPFRTLDNIAVCETATDGYRRLVGLISIEKLCAAVDMQKAAELMDPGPGVVVGDVAHERAAWKAVRHGESSLGVAAPDGRFRGLIPPSRLPAGSTSRT